MARVRDLRTEGKRVSDQRDRMGPRVVDRTLAKADAELVRIVDRMNKTGVVLNRLAGQKKAKTGVVDKALRAARKAAAEVRGVVLRSEPFLGHEHATIVTHALGIAVAELDVLADNVRWAEHVHRLVKRR